MRRFSFSSTLLPLLVAMGSARADVTTTWDGTTGSWNDSGRWSGGVFPNNSAPNFYDAVINAGTVTLSQGIAINQLTLSGGAIAGASALSLAEGVQWSGGTLALTGNGSVVLGGGSATTVTGAPVFSSGTIFGGGGATLAVQPGATLTVLDGANFFAQVSSPAYTLSNSGTLIARNTAGPGFTTIDAQFDSTGTLRVENTGTSHTLSLAGGGTLGGAVHLDANTSLELGGSLTIAAGTTFTGTGTVAVAGTVTLDGGTSAPNLTVAVGELRLAGQTLTVASGAIIDDNGALAVELRGTGALAGKLALGGALTIHGRLAVSLGGGFTPAVGDVFDVLDFTGATGNFAAVQLPPLPAGRFWRTDQLYTEGKLSVGPVPATYAAWQAAYGTGAFSVDDDSDGTPNGLEYALGLAPDAGDISPVTASIAAGRLRLHFQMPEPGATDVTLRVEASDDLGVTDPWTVIATKVGAAAWSGTVTLVPAAGGRVAVVVQDTKLVSAAPKRFLQLRAELP
jgi:hypothetical protein